MRGSRDQIDREHLEDVLQVYPLKRDRKAQQPVFCRPVINKAYPFSLKRDPVLGCVDEWGFE